MRFSPAGDPGTPDARSATRYLVWLAGRHPVIFGAGLALGVIWMLAQALVPAVLGRAVEAGLAQRDPDALVRWSLALLGLGLVQAVAGILRHRCAVHNWLGAAYRTVQVTVDATNRLGAALPRRVAAGEVVSIGTADIEHIGSAIDITARGAGSVVGIVTVAVILLSASQPLGLVVVLGVPLLMALVALLIRPLHRQQAAYRDSTGRLTARAADIVSGLRVLRGVGGEQVLSERYRQRSQALRADGLRVARVESLLQAAQILLPGVFVVLVTWLGARFALRGEISAGELVSFYGYTAFLVSPLRNLTEAADKLTRGHVAARRVVRLLRLAPEFTDPATPVPVPAGPGELADVRSGLVLRPGRLTALAAATPQDATEIADRLGRYADGDVTLHGVPLRDVALATVRERILVADNDAQLFSGVLRTELDPHDRAE
ncbi:ABC transporter transmembrane domain-containing protein, partial [Micromonospora aurantiaca (nom. illeg.)]|uniref:ABC transporter transmembrane domain-containing protein n=1 Tax=Micromonospora aurantiaca (nom. illeg.) TaxID=47850 RepID=UPI0037F51FF0